MNNKRWTERELELVRENTVPPTRTLTATRCIANRYHIEFTTRKTLPSMVRMHAKNLGALIVRLYGFGMTRKEVAELLGFTPRSVAVYYNQYQHSIQKETTK